MTSSGPTAPAPEFGGDETLPWLFRVSDAASNAGQRAFMQFTSLTLIMLVVAAGASPLIAVFTDSGGAQRWSALFAAAAFVIAILERSYALTARPERSWYEGRALAESTKTLAWRYAVGAAPYEIASADADSRFATRLRSILLSFPDLELNPQATRSEQITTQMRELRAAPLARRKQAYKQHRIEEQRVWYSERAIKHGKRGRRLGVATLVIECCGAMLAILLAASVIHADPLSIVAATASGLIAWERAHQDTTIAKAYGIAAQELASISDLIGPQEREEDWSRFVVEAEDAVSREHTLWKASRSVETGPSPEDG